MTVSQGINGSGEVQVREFAGGLYAVARCTLENIGEAWQSLVASVEQSSYEIGSGQCLEECLSSAPAEFPTATFDLYLPVKK
jgi:DNA gyrase inhibitor GyrI